MLLFQAFNLSPEPLPVPLLLPVVCSHGWCCSGACSPGGRKDGAREEKVVPDPLSARGHGAMGMAWMRARRWSEAEQPLCSSEPPLAHCPLLPLALPWDLLQVSAIGILSHGNLHTWQGTVTVLTPWALSGRELHHSVTLPHPSVPSVPHPGHFPLPSCCEMRTAEALSPSCSVQGAAAFYRVPSH